MKSTHVAPVPNMRGKKSYTFRCRCCDAYDFRERERIKAAEADIRKAMHNQLDDEFLHPAEERMYRELDFGELWPTSTPS